MATTFPGTTIEVTELKKGSSKALFDGIFAAGGITLSQVSVMTGLEPHVIQNWVKRGFLSSPVKRQYSRQQFARIIIINMLRDSIQIDRICELIRVIEGEVNDPNDDLIRDNELYHRYVDMLSELRFDMIDGDTVMQAAENASADYVERVPGEKKKLCRLLQVMFYAHTASRVKEKACELLATLD